VLDFTLPYTCGACGTLSAQPIDVAEHHAVLKFATAPELRCHACKAPMQCSASEAAMTILPALPKPVINKELAKTIAELRARKLEKKVAPVVAAKAPSERPPRSIGMQLLLAMVVLAVGAAGIMAYQKLSHRDRGPFNLGPVVARSSAERPAWLAADLGPSAQACTRASGGALTCVGASVALASQQDAEDEASDAVYEVLAHELAGKGEKWLDSVAPMVLEQREATLAAYNRDPLSTQARRDVHDGMHAVARVIRRVAPPVAARFWEAYDGDDGRRFVAFAQLTLPAADAKHLHDGARGEASALGATVVDYFPELGWRFPRLDHGAVVTKLDHGVLQDLGLAEHQIVLAIDGHDVADAAAFAKIATEELAQLSDRGGSLRLLVQSETGDPREFSRTIPGKQIEVVPTQHTPHGPRNGNPNSGSGGVNVWDRFGGSSHGGRDDPTQ
jgi:hypothetical protein